MKSMFIDILPFVVKMLGDPWCLVSMVKDNPKTVLGVLGLLNSNYSHHTFAVQCSGLNFDCEDKYLQFSWYIFPCCYCC